MNYSELARRFLATVAGSSDRFTRAELEDLRLEALHEVGTDLLLFSARLAAEGLPPFTAAQHSRAVILKNWAQYRDEPAGAFIDGGAL